MKLRCEVVMRCHAALADPEHLPERVAISAELLQLAERKGHTKALLRASGGRIETCIEWADYDEALEAAAHMESLTEQVRQLLYRWQAKLVRAVEAYVLGQLSLAESCAEEARTGVCRIDDAKRFD